MFEFITKGVTDKLKKELGSLTGPQVAVAVSKAINHTLGVANTEMNRGIRSNYNIPLTELNKGKRLIKSSSNNLTAFIYASTTPLPLALFNPVQVSEGVKTFRSGGQKGAFVSQKTKSKQTGVKVTVVKGRTKTIFDAFISISSIKGKGSVIGLGRYNGSSFAFDPRGIRESRLNSTSVYIPSVDRDVKKKLNDKIASVLPSRIIHEIARIK
jgi:hypothetical protein